MVVSIEGPLLNSVTVLEIFSRNQTLPIIDFMLLLLCPTEDSSTPIAVSQLTYRQKTVPTPT